MMIFFHKSTMGSQQLRKTASHVVMGKLKLKRARNGEKRELN